MGGSGLYLLLTLFSRSPVSSLAVDGSMETSFQTMKPVSISYYDLKDKEKDLSAMIEDGFGQNGLGIISVSDVPGFSMLRERLLDLLPRFFNLPDKAKKELEVPESRGALGWSFCSGINKSSGDVFALVYIIAGSSSVFIDSVEQLDQAIGSVKSTFVANPIVDIPTTDTSLVKRYPAYCQPNKWPTNELPELEVAFKALGKLMMDVGLLLAYHCDRHGSREQAMDDDEGLQGMLRRSRCFKGLLPYYHPRQESDCMEDVSTMFSWSEWHTDWGSLTGLTRGMFMRNSERITYENNAAGLYVKNRDDQIIKVLYGEDEIAYQIGEITQILSKGRLNATPHAVRAPKGEAAFGVARTTFVLFMQPNWDEILHFPDEIPHHQELVTPNETLTFGEYTQRRIAKDFS